MGGGTVILLVFEVLSSKESEFGCVFEYSHSKEVNIPLVYK